MPSPSTGTSCSPIGRATGRSEGGTPVARGRLGALASGSATISAVGGQSSEHGRERRLRVLLSCPYSLSLVGGVQTQVLGLAPTLRALGVDARVIAPCDGPPPAPGIISVGPSTRLPSNGSVAPIATGRAVARRTLEALRSFTPDVLHLHEPFAPGANHAALVGTTLPAVGTFHSARSGRNGWYDTFRTGLRPMLRRLSVATAVSADAARQVEMTFHTECEIVPNGVEVDRYDHAEPWPAPAVPAILFFGRHEPRKGLAVLLDAFARLDREAVLWVAGEGPQSRATPPRCSEQRRPVARSDQRRREGAPVACSHGRVLSRDRRRVVRRRAARGDGERDGRRRVGHRRVPHGGARRQRGPPGRARRSRRARRRAASGPRRPARLVPRWSRPDGRGRRSSR